MTTKRKVFESVSAAVLAVTALVYIIVRTVPLFGAPKAADMREGLLVLLPVLIAEWEIYKGFQYFLFAQPREADRARAVRKNMICAFVILAGVLVGILETVFHFSISADSWLFLVGCMLVLLAIRHLGSAIRACTKRSGQESGSTAFKVIRIIAAALFLIVTIQFACLTLLYFFIMAIK